MFSNRLRSCATSPLARSARCELENWEFWGLGIADGVELQGYVAKRPLSVVRLAGIGPAV